MKNLPGITSVSFCIALAFLAAVFFPAEGAERLNLAALPPAAKERIDFKRDVEPLLTARCVKCHGAQKQKNGFRLDRQAEALAGGDDGRDIIPGKSSESRLIQYVAGLEEEKLMPPAREEGGRLSAREIGLLRAWIDQGADWPKEATVGSGGATHWSFVAPRRPEIPRVKNARWVRNPIDHFILARLEKEKIKPSPEADRATLIRRLSLDLAGLPPVPSEVAAFLADRSPDAYERAVGRALASPHFGEQWGRHWLDLARYADTDGYEKDFYRPHAWRWRDWVIESLNRDQPFDEFTRDQIAGDLLTNATIEGRIATGFHRNNLLNREGGVDIEEDRCKIVVDRVSTVGTVWLGLTVGCAECHSHKYDPISQKEFYQLYAFFNSTDDRDIRAPVSARMSEERGRQTVLDRAKEKYAATGSAEMEAWVKRIAALPDIWFMPRQEDYELPTFGANNGANLYPQEDGSFLVTGMVENKTYYIMMLNTGLSNITAVRLEAMTDEMLPKLGPGWAANGNFVLSELHVESASLKDVTHLRTNAIQSAVADYSQPGFPISATMDGVATNGWAVDRPHLPMTGVDRCAVFTLKENIGDGTGTRLKVSLVQNEGRSHTLGRVRVTYTSADRALLAGQEVPQRIRDIARIPAGQRALDQRALLKRYYEMTFAPEAPELADYTRVLAESPAVKGEVEAQTVAERGRERATHVHIRGNFLDHGAEVQPGTPAVLHPFKARGEKADRLDLANWLNDPANPLTARVAVNRMWMHLFGEGLVPSVGDFGTQGDKPMHPELLDWLASEFVKCGWSRKEMIRQIVLSATYRQASAVREDLLGRDVKNRLWARQNRFRLTAENARDQFLAAGGMIDETIGGPSVPNGSKRRGLYLQIKRAQIDYLLTTFDAPNTTQTCPRRERSNTPLQALTLMNDKLFVECAKGLAGRVMAEAGGNREEGLRRAFSIVLARPPERAETKELEGLFQRVQDYYGKNLELATTLVAGMKRGSGAEAETAAWVAVARTILNLDAVITRE